MAKTQQQSAKRKRAATDPIDEVNQKSDDQFVKDHLRPSRATYSLALAGAGRLSGADLDACYRLVEETSRADYEASTTGWRPAKKRAEMRSADLRYVLVRDAAGEGAAVRGFASLMPTYEEGEPVLYCYEIHLRPELQGTGLGRSLMALLESTAAHTPPIQKVMLTCFLSNAKALGFYESLGFAPDAISPVPRRLRYGRKFVPDYVIMSKTVESRAGPPGIASS